MTDKPPLPQAQIVDLAAAETACPCLSRNPTTTCGFCWSDGHEISGKGCYPCKGTSTVARFPWARMSGPLGIIHRAATLEEIKLKLDDLIIEYEVDIETTKGHENGDFRAILHTGQCGMGNGPTEAFIAAVHAAWKAETK